MEQQVALCKAFTDHDIKAALFSIPNHKSPEPDGYTSGFFKHTWNMTHHMVCNAVKEFFSTGYMPRYLSTTKLIILPKVFILSPSLSSDQFHAAVSSTNAYPS